MLQKSHKRWDFTGDFTAEFPADFTTEFPADFTADFTDSHFRFDIILKVILYTLIFQNYGQQNKK